MCMLTFYPENVIPVDGGEALRNGAYVNDHGHGYAIVAGSRLIIRKSMDYERLITEFLEMRARHSRGPALFHSRYGTGGSVDKSNCHPFRFRGDRRTVVAHNGILPLEMHPPKKDKRSDTRYAADTVFPKRYGFLGKVRNRRVLADDIGKWNKLVILTVNPAYPERAYIVNESSGTWHTDGVWYSSRDFEGWSTAGWYEVTRTDTRNGTRCPFCGDFGDVDAMAGFCLRCGTCLDCLEAADDCQCYVPEHVKGQDYVDWWLARDSESPLTRETVVKALRKKESDA